MFFIFIPRPSLVEMKIKRGLLFLRCALAPIRTGVSVIPFASLAAVLPVHGRIAIISR